MYISLPETVSHHVSDAIEDDLTKASTEKKHAKIRKKKIEKSKAIEEVQGGAMDDAKKAETLADYAEARGRIKRQQAERKVSILHCSFFSLLSTAETFF